MADENTYPTTIAELTAKIEEGWPQVFMSVRAVEYICEPKAVGSRVAIVTEQLPVAHKTFRDGLAIPEVCAPPLLGQRFFSERDAVVATWVNFSEQYKPKDVVTGYTPVALIWRKKPVVEEVSGTFKTYMRLSLVWKNEEGDLVTSFNGGSNG